MAHSPYEKKNKEFAKSWKRASKTGVVFGGLLGAFMYAIFSVMAWALKWLFMVFVWLGKLLWRGLSFLWKKIKGRNLGK